MVPDLQVYDRLYPYGWLGILAEVPPSTDELIYSRHSGGFALHTMRTPQISRLYLQVPVDESIDNWPDDRIWAELQHRLALPGWSLKEGPILDKSITPMRSFVAAPMRHGLLFLAGDAAHIVPPTGAKGLNLAISDVVILAKALDGLLNQGSADLALAYSDTCLRRVWRATHFSWWMTSMLHVDPAAGPFDSRLQLAQLEYVVSSRASATTLAENYSGYRFPVLPARVTGQHYRPCYRLTGWWRGRRALASSADSAPTIPSGVSATGAASTSAGASRSSARSRCLSRWISRHAAAARLTPERAAQASPVRILVSRTVSSS
jgi:hypothetical protein